MKEKKLNVEELEKVTGGSIQEGPDVVKKVDPTYNNTTDNDGDEESDDSIPVIGILPKKLG